MLGTIVKKYSTRKARKMKVSQVELSKTKTDEEIRKLVRDHPDNGSYATYICRACGSFITKFNGDSLTAEIVGECSNCIESLKF